MFSKKMYILTFITLKDQFKFQFIHLISPLHLAIASAT